MRDNETIEERKFEGYDEAKEYACGVTIEDLQEMLCYFLEEYEDHMLVDTANELKRLFGLEELLK